jgi:DNA-binding IclR family transcriptional regulator
VVVKHVQSAARVLTAFEALAEHQPIGVSALSRILNDDKSGVQRALLTLADAGWIQRVPGGIEWEVTSRVLVLVQRRSGLVDRARATLEALRDETEETIILNVPEGGQIVVLEVVESNRLVRAAPNVGFTVPAGKSAAGQAILAHLPETELGSYLGSEPDGAELTRLGEVRRRGYAVNF